MGTDTTVSSREKRKGCFATFMEKKSKTYSALKMEEHTAESMEKAIENLSSVSKEELVDIPFSINFRLRECLHWVSPMILSSEQLNLTLQSRFY